jgi:hypothetical protein
MKCAKCVCAVAAVAAVVVVSGVAWYYKHYHCRVYKPVMRPAIADEEEPATTKEEEPAEDTTIGPQ